MLTVDEMQGAFRIYRPTLSGTVPQAASMDSLLSAIINRRIIASVFASATSSKGVRERRQSRAGTQRCRIRAFSYAENP